MTPKPANSFDTAVAALLAQKVQIENNLLSLQAACVNDSQRKALADSYHSAVAQYETALTMALVTNDAAVQSNVGQISTIQQQVQDAIDQAAAIAGILNKIATGIQIGTSILKMMAAA